MGNDGQVLIGLDVYALETGGAMEAPHVKLVGCLRVALVSLVFVSDVAVPGHDGSPPLIIAHPPSFGPADARRCCLLVAAGSVARGVDLGLCPGTRPVVS
jgi:hypothetical protein